MTIEDREFRKFRNPSGAWVVAVEVENASTNPIPVYQTSSSFQEYFKEYNSVVVASLSTENVISISPPTGKQYRIDGINLSSDNMCVLTMYHNSTESLKHRTSLTNFNAQIPIGGLVLDFGDTLLLTIYNPRPDPAEVNCLAYGAQNDV